MRNIYLSFLTLCLLSVSFSCKQTSRKALPDISPEFKAVLDAHGEWEKWYQAKAQSYAMIHEGVLTEEDAFINMDSRKIRLSNTEFEMGFDGEQTWISPNREAYKGKSLRFYHNLYFYFFNIPYIFTDPGVTVAKANPKKINGKEYPTFSVSFEEEKGASPDDQYYLLINPETNRLEYLLYTVTFFGAENPPFNALKYEDYRSSDGVYFPRILTGYAYENDSLKNIKYQVSFADALLLDEEFDAEIFEKPETGVYGD